jgi:hypothetical protein
MLCFRNEQENLSPWWPLNTVDPGNGIHRVCKANMHKGVRFLASDKLLLTLCVLHVLSGLVLIKASFILRMLHNFQ